MNGKRTITLMTLTGLLLALPVIAPASAEPQVPTYTVNSAADAADANPGDGACATAGGNCTLRAAIQEANLDSGASTITFASHVDINYPSLPALTEGGTLIDGSGQWDTGWDRPGVKVGGGAYHNGLLVIQADSCIVQGIEFSGGQSVGVHIDGGSYNTIGGSGAGQRNVFTVGTGGTGVWIDGGGSQNTITSNYFGTWDGTTAISNFRGIFVQSGGDTIANNLIVGATDSGILLWGDNCTVRDNIIGTNRFKTASLPNGIGIWADGDLNIIGPNNFVAGNTSHGVYLTHGIYNSVFGNEIGPWSPDLGNGGDGVYIHYADDNLIGGPIGNDISNNDGNGVFVRGDRNKVWGNKIRESGQDGVYVEGESNEVGGGGSDKRNEINGNGANGVHLSDTGTFSNTVAGNFIGLSYGEALYGNGGHGVLVENGANLNTIGGSGRGEGNWINGINYGTGQGGQSGVYLSGSDTHDNAIVGNVIGAPVHWQWQAPIGHHGISIYDGAHNNFIGLSGIGNTILNCGWSGIAIVNSSDNLVWFNNIGTDGADIHWGNSFYGLAVVGGTGNVIAFNEIAYSGTPDGLDEAEAGVYVGGAAALGNTIRANSIHDNDGPGIKLVEEGNYGAEPPTITAASCQGPVVGTACPGCAVEIFSDDGDEGRVYEATTTAEPEGYFSWSGTVNGPHVTATARDGNNSTSAFSAPFNVGSCNAAPTAAFTVSPTSGYTGTVFSFNASGCSDVEDPTSALQVRWDWENDGTYDTGWSTTKTASKSFVTTGQHTVRLEVQDTGGLTNATTHQVTVREVGNQVFLPLVVCNSP